MNLTITNITIEHTAAGWGVHNLHATRKHPRCRCDQVWVDFNEDGTCTLGGNAGGPPMTIKGWGWGLV